MPLMLLVAVCGLTAPAIGAQTPATVSRAHKLLNCATTLPDMVDAQVVEIPNTDFPNSGAAVVAITSSASAPLHVVRYTACIRVFVKDAVNHISVPIIADTSTSSPTAEVVAALNLDDRGWRPTSFFPFDSTTPHPYAATQNCYTTDSSQYYLELEQIRDRGDRVLSFLARATPPQLLVTCDLALFPVAAYFDSLEVLANAQFPLWPLTRVSHGYGDTQGITTYFCSATSADLIESFMEKRLPAVGWTPLTVAGARLWKLNSGVGPVYMHIYPVTNSHKWSILTYNTGTNLG